MTKSEAARHCGVTPQTLDGWIKSGVAWFPQDAVTIGANGRITDIDGHAVKAAMDRRDAATRDSSNSGSNLQKLKTAKLLEEVKLARLAVEKAEFERKLRERNILPRSEYEAFFADVIIITRDALQAMPGQFAKIGATPEQQGKIYGESERIVRATLQQMEELLHRKGELFAMEADDAQIST